MKDTDNTILVLPAVSLVLNLGAFYLIVSLNKKLFRDVEKGGYGLRGVATLTFFQVWLLLAYCALATSRMQRRISDGRLLCSTSPRG